jgi:hypothetical protein
MTRILTKDKLPAVQWKIKNLEKMSKEKFEENLRKTKEALRA